MDSETGHDSWSFRFRKAGRVSLPQAFRRRKTNPKLYEKPRDPRHEQRGILCPPQIYRILSRSQKVLCFLPFGRQGWVNPYKETRFKKTIRVSKGLICLPQCLEPSGIIPCFQNFGIGSSFVYVWGPLEKVVLWLGPDPAAPPGYENRQWSSPEDLVTRFP